MGDAHRENFLRPKEYWELVEKGIPTTIEYSTLREVKRKHIVSKKLKNLKTKN